MASDAQPSDQIIGDAGYIVSSQYRELVVAALLDGSKTPTKVVEYHDDEPDFSHISRALSQLRDEGIVELLVPEDRRKGRIYGLTDAGSKAAEFAVEM